MEPVTNLDFFEFLFGDVTGYLCIAEMKRRNSGKKNVKQLFFEYPDELEDAVDYIEQSMRSADIYFAPFLTLRKRRKKEDINETAVAWSDGDLCPLEALKVPPSIVVRSSKANDVEKYHFYWKFKEPEPSDVGEYISKKIAYAHEDDGMDQGGWDLTQLLRVPGTLNHKYTPPQQVSRAVIDRTALYTIEDFDIYPEVEHNTEFIAIDEIDLPDQSAKEILTAYKKQLNPKAFDLFTQVPTKDWSKALWELELILLEGELDLGETFVVCREAACNKYRRELRSDKNLWKEIQKAAKVVADRQSLPPAVDVDILNISLEPPELLTDYERTIVEGNYTFIEQYTDWAKTLGDAAVQYHPAGAFVILSSLMSGTVKLPTSFGTVVPNLWFMILADTTLTRKSTAMDNATDLLFDVDSDILLATDGSIEGLMTAMATRSGRPSLFLRDEVTGLVEAITKKEYLAGMMETLTKLYDGKPMKRILRRETVDVRDPRLIFFSGGIRSKMLDILGYQHVSSGFLPRFIFITAESDITRLKPIGPPTKEDLTAKNDLLSKMTSMYQKYAVNSATSTGTTVTLNREWPVELTSDAWDRYNEFEVALLDFAMKSHDPSLLTPMMDRLAKSGLKASVLLAASKMPHNKIEVQLIDILHAFRYIEQWAKHTMYIVNNLGTSQDEKKMQRILDEVQSNPGVTRSALMQKNYLTAKDADTIFITLEQRNTIRREKRGGRAERIYPV